MSVAMEEDTPCIRTYVVCLIDLLNQSEELEKWALHPPSGMLSHDFISAFYRTAHRVRQFKEMFRYYFLAGGERRVPAILNSVPVTVQEEYLRCRGCEPTTQQFSDTFLFHAPLGNEYEDVIISPLQNILYACSWAMIISLAAGTPLRGSVCLGLGAELEKGNLYGPVLAEACRIEKEAARYPRIVVSDEVFHLITDTTPFSRSRNVAAFMDILKGDCRKLLCKDHYDGRLIVDYLGQGMLDLQRCGGYNLVPCIARAYRFVCSQKSKLEKEAGKEVLVERYINLKRYFDDRIAFWGLRHIRD